MGAGTPATRSCPLTAAVAAFFGLGPCAYALAQDVAELAIVLPGTGQTGSAQRSLGRTVGGSIGNASHAVGGRSRPAGKAGPHPRAITWHSTARTLANRETRRARSTTGQPSMSVGGSIRRHCVLRAQLPRPATDPRPAARRQRFWRPSISPSTNDGSASVDVSPSEPKSFSAILRKMRRMILPERVLGSAGVKCR